MQFVTTSLLQITCDVVYHNFSNAYGFSSDSLRVLSQNRPVVVNVGNLQAIRELKTLLPNAIAVWVEGDLGEARAVAESDEQADFTFRLKAVSHQMAQAERDYEQFRELFEFKVVNDRGESWVERQLDTFLLAFMSDAQHEVLYSADSDARSGGFVETVSEALELRLLAYRPDDLLRLSPREFERLIAELLARDGYEVELTPETRDGGFDIVAVKRAGIAVPQLCLVECKRYSHVKRVGVQPVRQLYGVVSEQNASAGLVVTSSFFTSPALAFQQRVGHRLGLRDYESLKAWLSRYR